MQKLNHITDVFVQHYNLSTNSLCMYLDFFCPWKDAYSSPQLTVTKNVYNSNTDCIQSKKFEPDLLVAFVNN